jgi:hypothetical protein
VYPATACATITIAPGGAASVKLIPSEANSANEKAPLVASRTESDGDAPVPSARTAFPCPSMTWPLTILYGSYWNVTFVVWPATALTVREDGSV